MFIILLLIIFGALLLLTTCGGWYLITNKVIKDTNETIKIVGYVVLVILSLFLFFNSKGIYLSVWNCFDSAEKETIVESVHEIVTLEDNLVTEGRLRSGFAYGSGYINTDLYYFIMIEQTYGKKVFKLNSNSTYLQATDETPKVEYYTRRIKNNFFRFMASGTIWDEHYNKYQILYIPNDAIEVKYNVDLK